MPRTTTTIVLEEVIDLVVAFFQKFSPFLL